MDVCVCIFFVYTRAYTLFLGLDLGKRRCAGVWVWDAGVSCERVRERARARARVACACLFTLPSHN